MNYDLRLGRQKRARKACSTGTPNAKRLRLGTRPAPGGDPLPPAEGGWAICSFRVLSFPSAKHAKQSQTWAPLGVWGTMSRVLYKQTRFGGTPAATCRLEPARAGCTNKPNSAQSRQARRTNKPNLPPPDGQAGPWLELIVSNKPNFGERTSRAGGRSCETKPIPGGAGWDESLGATAPNKANPPTGTEAILRNKANPARPANGASTLWERSYGQSSLQEVSAKQSQYPATRAARGLGCTNKANWREAIVQNKANQNHRQSRMGHAWGTGAGTPNKANFRQRHFGETKPILPKRPGVGAGCQAREVTARGQMCETNPIGPESGAVDQPCRSILKLAQDSYPFFP
jgi:hypothetical protein